MKIIKKCIYCDGEIKPVQEFFSQDIRKKFKKLGILDTENYNCIECGQMYDKYLKPMDIKLAWLKT